MARLAPSILSADFANLGEDIKAVDLAGADIIHVDVMDGLFVPSISFGMPVIKSIRKVTEKPFDVHLMINEPIRYIDDFIEAGADWITIHVEACEDVEATLKKIKEAGVRPAISLNPETDVEKIIPYLEMVEMVLVMSVNPGFGGQKLIPETLEKVRKLRKLIDERALRCDIEIDGGINLDNVEGIVKDGADIIVAGSAVFKDPAVNTRAFLEKISGR
ncbi:MAG: ribulose-phosphate 3-epimerase [Clostridiales bacterium]|nr:ribulose-phosphate 3-epimerase [Clostridiales bacterium]MBS5877982.1 ribulose-phosphate 3-epimerase [Clostridiales bacterium]MDU0939876.1 ribulose-phosphate 3-epimerase [Clostridiales bacterium]MDU1042442.1 ribulose-phosphate 3-epimerase [Clostridiales bacterium]MDU3490032.1 ribulose-phosphate 3-epimerase [Clostridiales bacterium]